MKTVIQVPIDRDLLERIDGRAKADNSSRAALIRTACALYLREREQEEWDEEYAAGYRRIPESVSDEEGIAWLLAADLPPDEWPEARMKGS